MDSLSPPVEASRHWVQEAYSQFLEDIHNQGHIGKQVHRIRSAVEGGCGPAAGRYPLMVGSGIAAYYSCVAPFLGLEHL